jgi:hypothetical protein
LALRVRKYLIPARFDRAERWPSGRRHQIANLAYWVTGTEGSNPSLSASKSLIFQRFWRIGGNPRVGRASRAVVEPENAAHRSKRAKIPLNSLFAI